jgi:hypothetical protein
MVFRINPAAAWQPLFLPNSHKFSTCLIRHRTFKCTAYSGLNVFSLLYYVFEVPFDQTTTVWCRIVITLRNSSVSYPGTPSHIQAEIGDRLKSRVIENLTIQEISFRCVTRTGRNMRKRDTKHTAISRKVRRMYHCILPWGVPRVLRSPSQY